MFVEKRKHQRLKIKLNARIECENGYSSDVKTQNISFGGLYLDLDSTSKILLKEGDICNVTLLLNNEEVENLIPLIFQCKVVRCSNRGYGMNFIYIEGLEAYPMIILRR